MIINQINISTRIAKLEDKVFDRTILDRLPVKKNNVNVIIY